LQDQPENYTTPSIPGAPPPNIRLQDPSLGTETPQKRRDANPPHPNMAQNTQKLQETEDRDVEMEMEEHDLAGVDLEHLEHAYR